MSFTIQQTVMNSTKEWVCVARLGGCGDNLIASSVLPLLAKKYNVEVIAADPFHVVFENNPFVAKLTVKKQGELPEGDEWHKWFRSRAKEYRHLWNLSHSCETTLAFVRAQTQFDWPAEWRRKRCNVNYLEFVHDIVGVPHQFDPRFFPSEAELAQAHETKRRAASAGQKIIAWCLSGSRLDKTYPYTPMVVARLIKELGAVVWMFGHADKEFEMAKTIMEHVKRQNGSDDGLRFIARPVDGKVLWPLRRVLTQISLCDLAIGPDTGPMWSVAMSDMPKLMLLSHASEENITKHWRNTTTLHADQRRVPCWPCHLLHDDPSTCTPNADNNGAACISDISAEAIMDNARLLLKGV